MADLPRLIDDATDSELTAALARTRISEDCREGLLDYFRFGIRPGSFLQAVLEDSLFKSVSRADDQNRAAICDFALFLLHKAPIASWGSQAAVDYWLSRGVAARAALEQHA